MPRIWRTNDGRHVADGHPDAASSLTARATCPRPTSWPRSRARPRPSAAGNPLTSRLPTPDDKGGLTVTRLREKGVPEA